MAVPLARLIAVAVRWARREEAYPYGPNAEAIGLRPGVGIWFRMEFDIWDRPEGM
jgi:hypothetical protein